MSWEDVKLEMVNEKGLDPEVADRIGNFVLHKGEPNTLLNKLREEKFFGDHEGANNALNDLGLLFKFLEAMNSLRFLSFDLSLARGLDYYTGVIYEVVLTDGSTQMGSIAAGGVSIALNFIIMAPHILILTDLYIACHSVTIILLVCLVHLVNKRLVLELSLIHI